MKAKMAAASLYRGARHRYLQNGTVKLPALPGRAAICRRRSRNDADRTLCGEEEEENSVGVPRRGGAACHRGAFCNALPHRAGCRQGVSDARRLEEKICDMCSWNISRRAAAQRRDDTALPPANCHLLPLHARTAAPVLLSVGEFTAAMRPHCTFCCGCTFCCVSCRHGGGATTSGWASIHYLPAAAILYRGRSASLCCAICMLWVIRYGNYAMQ